MATDPKFDFGGKVDMIVHETTFQGFTKALTWGVIAVVVILGLMALALV